MVGLVLAAVALARDDWREWVAAAAVLATFGHASVAERMREREEARDEVEVDCVRWTWRYFVAKEILWAAFFVLTGAYAALAGVGVFLVYPLWRRWWRCRCPLGRNVKMSAVAGRPAAGVESKEGTSPVPDLRSPTRARAVKEAKRPPDFG